MSMMLRVTIFFLAGTGKERSGCNMQLHSNWAYSDYLWMMKTKGVADSFSNYLNKTGAFKGTLINDQVSHYAGDHLRLQQDYFFLDGQRIDYDREINFRDLENGLSLVADDLSLPLNFFEKRLNESQHKKTHYSYFYNHNKKELVTEKYKQDIQFFNFKYVEKKNFLQQFISYIPVDTVYFRLTNAIRNRESRVKQLKTRC
jgi:hypothetical protein